MRELKQRIVVLEDKPKRVDIFKHWFQNYDCVVTKTIREAVNLLLEKQADYLFLDFDIHDKGDRTLREWLRVHPQRRELDGLDLAEYVARMPDEKRPKNIVVHSRNPSGRRLMMKHLERKKLSPVLWKFWYAYRGPDESIPPPVLPPPSPPRPKVSSSPSQIEKWYAKYLKS